MTLADGEGAGGPDDVAWTAPAAPVAIAAAVRIFATTPLAPSPLIPPTA
jgi:hypothetical protein